MHLMSNVSIKLFLSLFFSLGLLFQTNNATAQVSQQSGFPQDIGGGGFGYSSPVFGNLDNDSDLEIVVGSFDGKVYAFNPDGSQVFAYNTGTAIDATPTLADIDGDGKLEIIVTLGSSIASTQRGGLIVLENDGTLKSKLDGTEAQNSRNGVPASPTLIIPGDFLPEGVGDGNADYVDGSVAVRDINGDGSPDLVFGANDTNIYALKNDLTLVDSRKDDDGDGQINEDPGYERKGGGQHDDDGDITTRCSGKPTPDPCLDEDPIDWPITNQDTLSSTPALGDVDGDGDIEVVIGGGSSAAAASTCQEGGTIWVLHHAGNADKARFGTNIPGTNVVRLAPTGCTKAAIFSSPALVDIDNDNKLEIFVGTSSDTRHGTNPNLVYGLKYNASNNTLEDLPGWPVSTGGFITSSPAIGDIDGDGQVEIVVASGSPDGKIYALHTNGSTVSGFPVKPTSEGTGTVGSPVIADVNGDGKADIIVGNAFDLFAFDGSGSLLSGFGGRTAIIAGAPNDPTILTGADGLVNSTPAVGDIDNDGKVEIAFVSSVPVGKLYVIEVGAATGVLPWPMFHRNTAHTGVYELNDQPPADVIKVSTNKTRYGEGDTMTLYWSLNNSGSKGFEADVFLGAAFPDGSLLFFTSLKGDSFTIVPAAQAGDSRNFKPAASSHNIAANSTMSQTQFFSYAPLPEGSGGGFIAFAALAKPGTVQAGTPQIIGIDFANFTY